MFEKNKLKKELDKKKILIEEIERKRYRSQSQLVEAILKQETPDDEDVDYFNRYTEQIEALRVNIRDLQRRMDEMN